MNPLWLLIDTACPRAMVALAKEGKVLSEKYLDDYRQHGECLAGAIDSCLTGAKVSQKDLGAIAVGVGPGSFIGVRIAIAHAKGLGAALSIPVIGFNTLAGIESHAAAFVALDARRSEFYVWKVGSLEESQLLGEMPESTYLEKNGPAVNKVVELLPVGIPLREDKLRPVYLRDAGC
ncbi:MAG: tRNA (adenosine(37)-N6)-threonylcarbamoyltransferase complex dimerization subunit type 1 TsaB [Deltaproteobacteria bacterium]|nr:tRNA (adenosine(37)-N6)-threonylcarbamoyltransferase complex dimerization subunit type 1 TsaB [Deltaproteobacteria bacterium]